MKQTAINLIIIFAAVYAVLFLHVLEAADYAYVEKIVDGDTIKI
jgi:hypothetical protein